MVLQEENVRLRPLDLSKDVEQAVPWYQDPEVLYYSEGGAVATPYDVNRVEAMYKYLLSKGEVFIIEIFKSDTWFAIGDAALCSDCLPIVIGIPKYRSRGIGQKVLALLIQYAKSIGKEKLRVNGMYSFNERSRRLYERQGFSAVETYIDNDGNESIRYELYLR